MPASILLCILATLPIAQSPYVSKDDVPVAARPQRKSMVPGAPVPTLQGIDPPARRMQPDDARLCDVSFTDPQHGWAVGDFGVILHTDDGGQHWSPQASGVTCTLTSVCFVDARIGWAVGGMAFPYLHDSTGLVLSTRDGGASWLREPAMVPALRKIRFLTDRRGWAVGCPSAMFPGGIFTTRDAGRSWQPACGGGSRQLLTGDFFDTRRAILGGALGLTATMGDGEFCRNPRIGNCFPAVHGMQVVPSAYGWLVGDGGWIALTGDAGRSWRPPLGALPPGAAIFDFAAMAVRGAKCWIVGSPGSRVFFTPDAGRSWSALPTGSTLPLTAITFADDLHGWAVGQLGLILATNDGGRSWKRQRAGGARAAVMAVAGAAQDLPLELLARVCKDQGYLGVAEVLGRDDTESVPRDDVPLADRLHQAMLLVGGSAGETTWRFPARPSELLLPAAVVARWGSAGASPVSDPEGGRDTLATAGVSDALLLHIVRQICIWRPSVILVPAGRTSDGLSQIVRQTALAAVKLSADPVFLRDSLRTAGCEAWKVERVCIVTAAGSRQGERAFGKIALAAADWSNALGETWADAALPAWGLLDGEYQDSAAVIRVELVAGESMAPLTSVSANGNEGGLRPLRVGELANRFDIMAGLASANVASRRRASDADSGFSSPLDGLAQGRQVQAVLQQLESDPQSVIDRLAKGDALPGGIDASAAAIMTFRIAQRLMHCGRWDLADKALALLIQRYPYDPLARWSLTWRLQYLAASEDPFATVTSTKDPPSGDHAASREKSRAEEAMVLAREIESNQPQLFAAPAVRYPLAAVYRRLDKAALAERLYALDSGGVDRDAWCACAQGETWLLDRKGPAPKPLAACVAVEQRPHLDGRLDEALWKQCRPISLASPLGDDRDWPARVMLAHDKQYLYVAIECRQAPGAHYEATSQRRQRDPDLSEHDRVDIFLDPDRDYATYYHLTIDHRGWAADAACSDRSWNPKWFVAAQTTDGVWTVEAALPLSELRAAIVPGKTVWALGVQRTVPGVGFQSWTKPAGPKVAPEGFGWLGFE